MKKFIIGIFITIIGIYFYQKLFKDLPDTKISETYLYCKTHNYNTDYCIFVDFSRYSGISRFYIYSFKENKILYKSLCSTGRGKENNIFNSTFSNKSGSNYSSLGKYKVGGLRKMSNPYFGKGYTVYGLDTSISNAYSRAILIHNGNPNFESVPLPALPVSKGCFAVSENMMQHIADIKKISNKPLLLYAYY